MSFDVPTRRGLLSAMAFVPVAIAAPAIASPHGYFEALRLEHLSLIKAGNRFTDDENPTYVRICHRLDDIERIMVHEKCRTIGDAKAKMRFMIDVADCGCVLDGDDALEVVRDISQYLL